MSDIFIIFRIKKFNENGIFNYWIVETKRMNSHIYIAQEIGSLVHDEIQKHHQHENVEFRHLKGLFLILFMASIIAILVFANEIIIHYRLLIYCCLKTL